MLWFLGRVLKPWHLISVVKARDEVYFNMTINMKPLTILLTVFSLLLFTANSHADEPKKDAKANRDKVYVVYTTGDSQVSGGGAVVSNVRVEDFLGMKCLVGEGDDHMKGVLVRIPMDKILMVTEYEDFDAWKAKVKEFMEAQGQ